MNSADARLERLIVVAAVAVVLEHHRLAHDHAAAEPVRWANVASGDRWR